jgi:hypothetical protein
MKKYILPALTANAAGLGIHWIYDPEFLRQEAKKASLLWRKQDAAFYASVSPSYFAYPHADIGDVSSQGMILFWLYRALKENPNLTVEGYQKLILDAFQPGGTYVGYAETYIYKLLFNATLTKFKRTDTPFENDDDHLVGFLPFLVTQELGLPTEKAFELTQLFSTKDDYLGLMKVLEIVFQRIQEPDLKTVLLEAAAIAPKRFQITLKKAVEMDDTAAFVKTYAGTACSIQQSIPIVFHLLPRVTSFDDMLEKNALISGAISERGMLLGALTAQRFGLPAVHEQRLSRKFFE